VFTPGAFTNARIEIRAGGQVIHRTTVAAVNPMGSWTCLTARDTARGSYVRAIIDTAKARRFGILSGPLRLAASSCHRPPPRLQSINGVAGDVRVVANQFLSVDDSVVPAILDAPDPKDRFPCPENPCAGQVVTINGQAPDQDGRISLRSDECLKIVPDGSNVVVANHCQACVNCADVFAINDQLVRQSEYLHRLSAIYQDQFNRHQGQVAVVNQKACYKDLLLCNGSVFFSGRAFDRPYFNQVILLFVNETDCALTLEVTCTMEPPDVGLQYNRVKGYVQGEFDTPEGRQQMVTEWEGFQ
jgi:hypothetical protein